MQIGSNNKQINNSRKKRVAVGLSGGVDSSVCAYLLLKEGYDVIGVTLKMFCYEEGKTDHRSCCSLSSILDAKEVAYSLGIPHYVLNIEDEFSRYVKDPFLDDYRKGRTPNPCIQCNRWVKFRAFWEKVKMFQVDFIATGHYAKIEKEGLQYLLMKPRDQKKDQTYFLYYLSQDLLSRILFPLALLTKEEVRSIALEAGLTTSKKPESQDICFVGKKPREYLKDELGIHKGFVESEHGEILGNHDGSFFYTVGQRAPISGGGPYYIYHIDSETNTLFVTKDSSSPLLFYKILEADDFHWIGETPSIGATLHAQTRYQQLSQSVTLLEVNKGRIKVQFETPQRVVASGQSLVLSQEDRILGGGIITKLHQESFSPIPPLTEEKKSCTIYSYSAGNSPS